jgi:hypothetical protein
MQSYRRRLGLGWATAQDERSWDAAALLIPPAGIPLLIGVGIVVTSLDHSLLRMCCLLISFPLSGSFGTSGKLQAIENTSTPGEQTSWAQRREKSKSVRVCLTACVEGEGQGKRMTKAWTLWQDDRTESSRDRTVRGNVDARTATKTWRCRADKLCEKVDGYSGTSPGVGARRRGARKKGKRQQGEK